MAPDAGTVSFAPGGTATVSFHGARGCGPSPVSSRKRNPCRCIGCQNEVRFSTSSTVTLPASSATGSRLVGASPVNSPGNDLPSTLHT